MNYIPYYIPTKFCSFIENNIDKITDIFCKDKHYINSYDRNTYGFIQLIRHISEIPEAIGILEDNLEYVDWVKFSSNSNAVSFLELNQNKIDLSYLCMNKNAIHLINKNIKLINKNNHYIETLYSNPGAIYLIKKDIDTIINLSKYNGDKENTKYFSSIVDNYHSEAIKIIEFQYEKILYNKDELLNNENIKERLSMNPYAIDFLEKYPQFIDWNYLSLNENAIDLLMLNKDKINYIYLANNTNPKAYYLAMEEYKKGNIHIHYFFTNPNAILLLEQKISTINGISWLFLLKNKGIYIYDYEKMKRNMYNSKFFYEYSKKIINPHRLNYYLEKYNYDITTDEYI